MKTHQDVEQYLGLEGIETIPWLPVANGFYPPFEYKVLENKGQHRIAQNTEGNICEVPKDGASMPRYVRYILETRKDW